MKRVHVDVLLRFIKSVEAGCMADYEEAKADYMEFHSDKAVKYVLNERINRLQDQLDFIEDLKEIVEDMERR